MNISDITPPTAFSTPQIVNSSKQNNDLINFSCSDISEIDNFKLQTNNDNECNNIM